VASNTLRIVTAYLRSLEAVSRKRILYHGTSPEVGHRVLSEGLVPDPKKRSWAEDPDVSFNIKFLYGSPSDARLKDFFKEYSEGMTQEFEVTDATGKSVIEPLKMHGLVEAPDV